METARWHGTTSWSTMSTTPQLWHLWRMPINVQEEPAVSYRWTGWVWENNRLKLETSGGLPITLEEYMEYTLNEWKQNRKMSTCNRLDLESFGSWLTLYIYICPKTSRALMPTNGRRDFFGIITGWEPSVCKSNRLHVDILWFSFIKLGYIL